MSEQTPRVNALVASFPAENSLRGLSDCYNTLLEFGRQLERELADAQEGAAPSGWVSVPKEPTREMMRAGEVGWCRLTNRHLPERAADCYTAMLAALPEPPAGSGEK